MLLNILRLAHETQLRTPEGQKLYSSVSLACLKFFSLVMLLMTNIIIHIDLLHYHTEPCNKEKVLGNDDTL